MRLLLLELLHQGLSEKVSESAVFFVPKMLANRTFVLTMVLVAHNGRAFGESLFENVGE